MRKYPENPDNLQHHWWVKWKNKYFKKRLRSYNYFWHEQMKQKHFKELHKMNMFILKVEIPYIIMKYDKNMKNFIKKNNVFLQMRDLGTKEEVTLNLTPEQVENIRSRWHTAILRDKKIKVDDMGITPIDLMIELLRCAGNLTECARRLGISRTQIRLIIERNETLEKISNEIEEMYLDYVEWQLKLLVDKGDRNAIQYFLNNRGNPRGYGSYEARRRLGKQSTKNQSSDDFTLE